MVDHTKVSNKPILVGLGLFVPGYSFTRVLDSLFKPLNEYYDIHWHGIAYKGAVVKHSHYTLYPCNLKGGDIYGAYGAAQLAIELEADVLLLINDVYMLRNYQKVWLPLKKQGIRLVAYTPLDGTIIDAEIVRDTIFLDDMVLYHDAAKTDVSKAMQDIASLHIEEHFDWPNMHAIYHGVDVTSFLQVGKDEKKELRKKIFKVENAQDCIYILNANRFNERKNIEATILAYEKALPYFNHTAYLVLHTPNMDKQKQKELDAIIASCGCKDLIILNPLGDSYCSDDQLRELYQACEIGINTSYGEGWGLISFEHAACGGAQIVPDHTCPGEIWKEVALVTPIASEIILQSNPFKMGAVDSDVLSHQIISLVNEEEKRIYIAQACYNLAVDERFNWAGIAKKWCEIL